MKGKLLLTVLFITASQIYGQNSFYKDGDVHEIKFYFKQTNWDYLLDSFYVKGDEERLLANINIDGTSYDSVGIRYKGYSSVSIDRKKNPFNIKLDWLINQDHNGIDKIKLSNVIQDPSFIREALSYEIARKYMPASGANYAKVYINDVYWGLYTSVQDVDKGFLRTSFGSGDNTFVKGNPKTLKLNGENCNLSNTQGTDSSDYYELYEMKSDYGYGDLYELIDTLNTSPANIETVLNVDRALWMHAFNYVLVNFDSYVGYAQNYYLYKDNNGQFNPILWDLNQSFASYRLTDASDYFQGFTIDQAKKIDPLLHYTSFSVHPRPLMRNLFNNDRYRKMYLAHIKTITEENFANGLYKTRASALQSGIDASVKSDTNKFYSYTDFTDNLTKTVTDLVDYPGISDLMDARTTYLQSYSGYNGGPVINQPTHQSSGQDLYINASVSNATEVIIAYRDNNFSLFTKSTMLDDGLHNDGASGDGIYGVLITDKESLQYYIYADNSTAGSFSPARAAYEFHSVENIPDVAINELCASNDNIITDPQGEYEDWVELFNNTNSDISLKGYFLSDDNSDLQKWTFPDVTIKANSYLLVWTDSDENDPGLHTNFKLSASGEAVYLSNTSSQIVDEITFGAIATDTTYGRSPNGVGSFSLMKPTPNAKNDEVHLNSNHLALDKSNVSIYPNPAEQILNVQLSKTGKYSMLLYDVNGRVVKNEQISKVHSQIDVSDVNPGLYFLQLVNEHSNYTSKLIIR